MKRIHTISSAMLAAVMLLATACSEELTDTDRTAANAVQIATATVGGDTPAQSRANIDATEFANGDAITLSTDAAGSVKYTYTKSDNGWTPNTQLYWGNTYPVTYYAAFPVNDKVTYNTFTLPTTQSSLTALEAANYMTATTGAFSEKPTDGSISLTFAHRTAQVVVKINKLRTVGNEGTLTNAKIYSPKSGYTDAKPSGNATEVIPFTATGTIGDELEAQYTALVIPGLATNHKLFSIVVGNNTLTYTTTVNFEANKIYTYALTIGTDRVALDGLTVKAWTTTEVSGTMLGYWEDYAATSFSGGSGTAADPYQINSAEDLAYLAKKILDFSNGKYFKLTKNLDLSGKLWTPISYWKAGEASSSFRSNFDGNGHTITGLTVRTNGTYASFGPGVGPGFGPGYAAGLFGGLIRSTISNLHLTNVDVRGDSYAGGLCGSMRESLIYGCTVDGKVAGATRVGGLVGSIEFDNSYLFACGTRCTVVAATSGTRTGGLVGYAGPLSVASSYASGTVSGVDGSTVRPLFGGYSGSLTGKWCASTQVGDINASHTTGCQTGVADYATLKNIIAPATNGSFSVRQYDSSTGAFASKRFFTDAAAWTDNTSNAGRCPWLPGTIAALDDYDVLEIGTKEQLMQLATDVNSGTSIAANVVLTADIDLAGEEWIPIGNATNSQKSMKSSFDGQGHTISNLTMNSTSIINPGLFGYVNCGVTIKNVILKDVKISAGSSGSYAGALLGETYRGPDTRIIYIDNCHVTGTSSVTVAIRAGGLAGKLSNTKMTRCSSTATVRGIYGTAFSGGLAGEAVNSSFYACYVTGAVSAPNAANDYCPGGIVGYSETSCTISGCYFTGTLTKKESPWGGRMIGNIYQTGKLSYCGAADISTLPFFAYNSGSGTITCIQCNNKDENTTDGVEVSVLYGIVANPANTTTFTVDGTIYNVKDCWTDNGSSAPTLKVKADGTTD